MRGFGVADSQAAIEREFAIVKPLWTLTPSYNVATQAVPVIRVVDGERTGVMLARLDDDLSSTPKANKFLLLTHAQRIPGSGGYFWG
jgi:hypothetical protein